MVTFEISHRARRWLRGQSKRRKHNRAEKTKYQEYLATPGFKNLRIACLAAHARNKQSFCFTCGLPGAPDQLRVHHLRYYRKDNAPLDPKADLVPVCNRCHDRIHELENGPLRQPGLTPESLRTEMQKLLIIEKAQKVQTWQRNHEINPRNCQLRKAARAAWQWLQKVNVPFDFFEAKDYFHGPSALDAPDVPEKIYALISKAEEARLATVAGRLQDRLLPCNPLLEDARLLVGVANRATPPGSRRLPPPPGLIPFYNLLPDYELWKIEQSLSRNDDRKPLNTPYNALLYLAEREAEANTSVAESWRNLVDEFEITDS